MSVFAIIITLMSSWVKKQNYVERISEIRKYSIKINRLKNKVKSILEEPIETRMHYEEFALEYKTSIVDYISNRPLISPYEWGNGIYNFKILSGVKNV